MNNPIKLSADQIAAVERILAEGDRAEIIPVKDGVKIFHIRRKEIKENTKAPA